MSQVSKRPLRKEVFERVFELLLKIVTDSQNPKEAELLLEDLLSPTEKIMLAKRLAIAVLLAKDYFYRTIEEILRVSKPTISMVSLSLKYSGAGYRNFAEKVLKEKKGEEFWDKVEDLVLSAMSHGKGGKGWRYLRNDLRRKKWQKKTEF